MDEIEAVKKAPALTDASFTAFFFSGKRKAKNSQRRCFAFLRMGMKQRKTSLRRRPECSTASKGQTAGNLSGVKYMIFCPPLCHAKNS